MSTAFTDALQENARLREQLVGYERNLARKDLEIAALKHAAEPPPVVESIHLSEAKRYAEKLLTEKGESLEEIRAIAWSQHNPYCTTPPPGESWPPNVDQTNFVKLWCGLNADGTALLNEPIVPEAPPTKTVTFLDALAAEGN
jgi:hypothetical protein